MFEILNYSEKAIAVTGDTKSVKDELKRLGGRFNPRLSCGAGWIFSAKKREEVEKLLNCQTSDKVFAKIAPKNDTDIKMSDALKAEIREEYKAIWGQDNSYSLGQVSNAVKLSDGKIIVMEKQRIKTSFCFGERGGDSYDEALDMAHIATTDEQYFINENMEYYNNLMHDVVESQKALPRRYYDYGKGGHIYIRRKMTYSSKDRNIFELSYFADWAHDESEFQAMQRGESDEWYSPTYEDYELIKKLVETERKRFEKRLHTYLKRYGLSKIRSWTYWLDA
jgi:hypothetical protein